MNILEKISLGESYFRIAMLLRESIFLNSVLTNGEVWYGLEKSDIKHLEDLDLILLRKMLNKPFSVPADAVYLELGWLNIETILKSRRLNYLHYLVNQDESSMLYQFFMAQWKYPGRKNEWTEQVKTDLVDFSFQVDLEKFKEKSKNSFKNQVKIKAREFSFFSYLERKEKHTKLDDLFYKELKLQEYFQREEIKQTEAQTIFSYRVRMSNFNENYRGKYGPKSCPMCNSHTDS